MPRIAKMLSPKAVAALPDGTHAVGGVDGLMLQVRNEGAAKSWVLRVRINGRRRVIGLGSYRDVSLADARRRAQAKRTAIANGEDPLAERRARRAAEMEAMNVLTFDEAARRYIAFKEVEWRNGKHRDQWRNTLATYASPVMGKVPVDQVTKDHVMRVLLPIWTTKTETATRVRGRIESVLDWAKAADMRTGDNPAQWKGNLDKLLPTPTKVARVEHHKSLPIDGMHEFMQALRKREGLAARALEFAILTAARSGEVRGATWDEIDLERAVWVIPGERMKAGKEHRVPLSPAAVELLDALPRIAGGLVFPGTKGQPLSNMSLLAVMKRMKVDAVPHGFRSTFRDWAAERTAYPSEMAEMALAHTISDKVEAAYRRGDMFAKRARMMADWAKFIDTPAGTGEVIQFPARAG